MASDAVSDAATQVEERQECVDLSKMCQFPDAFTLLFLNAFTAWDLQGVPSEVAAYRKARRENEVIE